MSLDKELDRLYGLPLDEFTSARNTLARDLRKDGDREASEEVKALAKPSISAWTVNQLARRERMQMRSLLTAGERLRKAQEKLVGGGNPKELQQALERQREVVAALLESAQQVLGSAGHPPTEATLTRVRSTLTAAAADEEGAQLLRDGRLTEDLDPTGFGPVALGTGAKAPPRRARGKEDAARKKRVEEAKQEVAGLRAEVRAQERTAKAARRTAEKEEKELERLGARLEAAEDSLAEALQK